MVTNWLQRVNQVTVDKRTVEWNVFKNYKQLAVPRHKKVSVSDDRLTAETQKTWSRSRGGERL